MTGPTFIEGEPPPSERQNEAAAQARFFAELRARPGVWARVSDEQLEEMGGGLAVTFALDDHGDLEWHRSADGRAWMRASTPLATARRRWKDWLTQAAVIAGSVAIAGALFLAVALAGCAPEPPPPAGARACQPTCLVVRTTIP
jgi:hypothetical protein